MRKRFHFHQLLLHKVLIPTKWGRMLSNMDVIHMDILRSFCANAVAPQALQQGQGAPCEGAGAALGGPQGEGGGVALHSVCGRPNAGMGVVGMK